MRIFPEYMRYHLLQPFLYSRRNGLVPPRSLAVPDDVLHAPRHAVVWCMEGLESHRDQSGTMQAITVDSTPKETLILRGKGNDWI